MQALSLNELTCKTREPYSVCHFKAHVSVGTCRVLQIREATGPTLWICVADFPQHSYSAATSVGFCHVKYCINIKKFKLFIRNKVNVTVANRKGER